MLWSYKLSTSKETEPFHGYRFFVQSALNPEERVLTRSDKSGKRGKLNYTDCGLCNNLNNLCSLPFQCVFCNPIFVKCISLCDFSVVFIFGEQNTSKNKTHKLYQACYEGWVNWIAGDRFWKSPYFLLAVFQLKHHPCRFIYFRIKGSSWGLMFIQDNVVVDFLSCKGVITYLKFDRWYTIMYLIVLVLLYISFAGTCN